MCFGGEGDIESRAFSAVNHKLVSFLNADHRKFLIPNLIPQFQIYFMVNNLEDVWSLSLFLVTICAIPSNYATMISQHIAIMKRMVPFFYFLHFP